MQATIKKLLEALPWLAIASLSLAAGACGAALPGYSHRSEPLALLGAHGIPQAAAFNLFGYLLPGVLWFACGHGLRRAWQARGWGARIGVALAQVSALAFAAQGLLPLDPADLDAAASRQHAAAWMLWWISACAALALLAWALRRTRGLALACASTALAVLLLAVVLPSPGWSGVAQRLAFAAWFAWWAWAMRASGRHPP